VGTRERVLVASGHALRRLSGGWDAGTVPDPRA